METKKEKKGLTASDVIVWGLIISFLVTIFGIFLDEKQEKNSSAPSALIFDKEPGEVFQDTLINGGFGPKMVVIPSRQDSVGTERFTIEFAIGQYEVTVNEFRQFAKMTSHTREGHRGSIRKNMGCWNLLTNKYESNLSWKKPGFSQTDKHPVVCISWLDAVKYTEWLTKKTGRRYSLPSEAEWEHAAQANTDTQYWWGNDVGKNQAVCDGCGSKFDNKRPAPVGSFQSNPYGLYDVSGNVLEWCADDSYVNASGVSIKNQSEITKNTDFGKVQRGGAWNNVPTEIRIANRIDGGLSRVNNAGFRVVMRFMKPSK
ncbi:MAG: SUMF1/EgtB/PvdO family nonheme iron enzyme [Candidatus Marithrix sp.]|nr:SUMF1/EgtB/PvdO family nonheme iron enzyme [Candidatus Marithrix sp.]